MRPNQSNSLRGPAAATANEVRSQPSTPHQLQPSFPPTWCAGGCVRQGAGERRSTAPGGRRLPPHARPPTSPQPSQEPRGARTLWTPTTPAEPADRSSGRQPHPAGIWPPGLRVLTSPDAPRSPAPPRPADWTAESADGQVGAGGKCVTQRGAFVRSGRELAAACTGASGTRRHGCEAVP